MDLYTVERFFGAHGKLCRHVRGDVHDVFDHVKTHGGTCVEKLRERAGDTHVLYIKVAV